MAAEKPQSPLPVRVARILGWPALYGLLAAGAFSWPSLPSHELDPSWRMALGYCFEQGMQFGREVVFTYGPLGFVMGKTYSGLQCWSLIAGQLVLALIAAGAILLPGRRLPGAGRALYFGFFLLFGTGYEDALHILVIALLGFELLRRVESSRPWRGGLIGGVLAGYAQIKFTDFLFATFVVVVVVAYTAWQGRRRAATGLALAYGGAYLGIWLACGQSLLNLPAYFYHSWQISEGYQWAMGFPTPAAALWKALVIVAVLAGYAALHLRLNPQKPRAVANAALLGAFLYLQWKHGFTRPDGHMLGFFICALLPLTAYPALLDDPARLRRTHRAVFIGAMALCLWGVENTLPGLVRRPLTIFQTKVVGNINSLIHWQETREHYRNRLAQEQSDTALPRTRRLVGQASLDVLGHEQGIALFNGFNYRPRPVIQGYCTFTPALVKLNGDFFASARVPQFVLQKVQSIDGRLPAMDDARALLLLAHRYRFVHLEKEHYLWQLAPGPFDPATVEPKPLRTATLEINRPLPVEDLAGQPLWVRIDLQPSLLGKIRRVLYKLPQVMLSVQDVAGITRDYLLPLPQGRSGFIVNPLIEDQEDYRRFAANQLDKRVRALTLKIPRAEAKYFAAAARVELSALPPFPDGASALSAPNADRFRLFQTAPLSYDAPAGMSVEKIDGREVAILHAPSQLVFAVPEGATTVSGMFGFLPAAYTKGGQTNGAHFIVSWSDGTERRHLYQKFLDPLHRAKDRGLQEFSVKLDGISGGRVYLLIDPGPHKSQAWDWAGWTDILIQ
jgi:hypothetical protein